MNDYLLSIIIPTYNRPNELKRLLLSIIDTNLPKEDYEVIVSDDSTEEFTEQNISLVIELQEKMNVNIYRNEYNKAAPGTNRQSGLNKAKGQWIIFADDDDAFIPESLFALKPYMVNADSDLVMIRTPWTHWEGDKVYIDPETPRYLNDIITHGKIYLRKFIETFNIGYALDGSYHEDVYFNFQAYCYTKVRSYSCYDDFVDIPFYKLNVETDSITRKNKSIDEYFENHIMNGTEEWLRSYFLKPYSILKNLSDEDREDFYYFYIPIFYYVIDTILIIQEKNNGKFNKIHTELFCKFFELWKQIFGINEYYEVQSWIEMIYNRDFRNKFYTFSRIYSFLDLLSLREHYILNHSEVENEKIIYNS